LQTERLILRPWREADREPFAALNADARVMEYMPSVLSRAQSDALAAELIAELEARTFGLWAIEVPGVAEFAGFVGLHVPTFEAPFTPCVELGWRLACDFWGRGYATEAARAAVRDGFERVGLAEVLAWTVPTNVRSRRVMEKIGMCRSPGDDFDHPRVQEGHPLRRHVLYRLGRDEFCRVRAGSD
jgi:RimJ/RimL family protein N-acetyltransferase